MSMARVTIEDCLVRIPSHFLLTMVAAKRARQLARGAVSVQPFGDHKSTVHALKEIADGQITSSVLGEADLPEIPQAKMDLESLDF